ncbi:YdcF family protein [Selenomonas sp. TAMA-11512]|nr:YdcF family protein [Selenomonas sp. TAMA-11512]
MLAGLTLLAYLFCSPLVAERTVGHLEGECPFPEAVSGDVIIMLGGGAFSDVPDVDGEGALTSSPANRLLTAVRLQRKLGIPILVSGGKVFQDSGTEALLAKRYLLGLGVPEEQIIVEDRSQNTTENAAFSARLLKEHGLSHPILVTSAFHLPRAVLNYEKHGIAVTPYPADYLSARQPIFHYVKLAPSADALQGNILVLREYLRTFVTRYME